MRSKPKSGDQIMRSVESGSQSESILQAAYDCLAEKGYADVSMRDIAERAQVALSQLHYYFKNKNTLFVAVVRKMTALYTQEITGQLEAYDSPHELLHQVTELFQDKIKNDPEWLRLWFDLVNRSLWDSSLRPHLSELFTELSSVFAERIFKRFPHSRPQHMAPLFLGTIYGIAIQALIDDTESSNLLNTLQAVPKLFHLAEAPAT